MVRPSGFSFVAFLALALTAALPAFAQTPAWSSDISAHFDGLDSAHAVYLSPIHSAPNSAHDPAEVATAIGRASQATGVDYDYLIATAQIESRLDPNARAKNSSAAGLFQFIEGTWLQGLDRYGADFGFSGRREQRSEVLALRYDPHLSAMLAAAYTRDHAETLKGVLGRDATPGELYLAHFLGSGGANTFLRARRSNPTAIAAILFAKAARANRPIFFTQSGQARSLDQVLELIDVKLAEASASARRSMRPAIGHRVCNPFFAYCQRITKLSGEKISKRDEVLFQRGLGTIHLKKLLFNQLLESDISEKVLNQRTVPTKGRGQQHKSTEQPQRDSLSTPDRRIACNHIEMCYTGRMSTSTITRVRDLIATGEFTKAGIARAAGLHANTLRDANEADWNPTADTLTKLQSFIDANDDTPVLVGIEEIIDEARNGRMYILVDDEDRENEGDLIIPAQMATPAAVNFMATHGRGLICLALDRARVDQLGLDPMSRNNKESMQTAFTVSIEAKEGVTTGISAADRARTVSVAIDATKGAEDIVTPGHVFPLMARDGGTLVRAGHTEAAVDISRLAGLNPSGVICEIMNEDGTMARLDDLIEFARQHDLKIGTIRDLIAYRMRNDHLVERIGERSFESDYGGQWRLITYRNTVSDGEAYVLQKGHVVPGGPTLARVHPISVFDDVLGAPGPRKRTLQRAMGAIGEHGSGVIVILTQRVGSSNEWSQDEQDRNIGIGSQILADLGVDDMVLLSNSRPDLVALDGYGITITDHMPIPE